MARNMEMEDVCLMLDNGDPLQFHGRLFSEGIDFDKESGSLTRRHLYVTDNGEQVYYIVRKEGKERTRHAYRISIHGDTCVINNGKMEVTMQLDMLMLAVRSLCGLNSNAIPTQEMVDEMLKAADN